MKLYTHLNFSGNSEEAFRFYEKHLDGKITMMMKKSQLPAEYDVQPGTEHAVVHARRSIAGIELIANDVPKSYFKPIRKLLPVPRPRLLRRGGPGLRGSCGWR